MADAPKSPYILSLEYKIAEQEIAIKNAVCAAQVIERKKAGLEALKAELAALKGVK